MSFLLIGFFLGLFSFRLFLHQQAQSPFLTDTAPAGDYLLIDQTGSANLYDPDRLTVILNSQIIDSSIKNQLSNHPTGFFPKKLRVTTTESFKPDEDFPAFDYHEYITYETENASKTTFQVYAVMISSLEDLVKLNQIDGIKNIEEWKTIKPVRSGPSLNHVDVRDQLDESY